MGDADFRRLIELDRGGTSTVSGGGVVIFLYALALPMLASRTGLTGRRSLIDGDGADSLSSSTISCQLDLKLCLDDARPLGVPKVESAMAADKWNDVGCGDKMGCLLTLNRGKISVLSPSSDEDESQ